MVSLVTVYILYRPVNSGLTQLHNKIKSVIESRIASTTSDTTSDHQNSHIPALAEVVHCIRGC